MSAKIIIIGTEHPLQCGVGNYSVSQREQYKKFIVEKVCFHKAALIAEEMSDRGLLEQESFKTVAFELYEEQKGQGTIEHLYIDIPYEGQRLLNIDNVSLNNFTWIKFPKNIDREKLRKSFRESLSNPVREIFWLAKMFALDKWPALLICGDSHVENMRKLIRKIDKDTFEQAYRLSEYLE